MAEKNKIKKVKINVDLEKRILTVENNPPFTLDGSLREAGLKKTEIQQEGISTITLMYNHDNHFVFAEIEKIRRYLSEMGLLGNRNQGNLELTYIQKGIENPMVQINIVGYIRANIQR